MFLFCLFWWWWWVGERDDEGAGVGIYFPRSVFVVMFLLYLDNLFFTRIVTRDSLLIFNFFSARYFP